MTPHVFEPAYYERLALMERRHWWAIGMREAARRILDRAHEGHEGERDRGKGHEGRAGWRVLDAGCGTGLTLEWARRYAAGEPVGLDRSPDALAHCRRGGHARLIAGSATELPFGGASFDLVLSNDVIQHLPRPGGDAAFAAEAARVLRPGGWLLVRTNSQCGIGPADAGDYHRYTLAEVRALALGAGFDVRVASHANCLPGLLETIRRTIARPAGARGDPGLQITPRSPDDSLMARALLWILRAEAWMIGARGWRLPFGHSIVLLARRR